MNPKFKDIRLYKYCVRTTDFQYNLMKFDTKVIETVQNRSIISLSSNSNQSILSYKKNIKPDSSFDTLKDKKQLKNSVPNFIYQPWVIWEKSAVEHEIGHRRNF